MYRGDKDLRLGIELCRNYDVRYTMLVPDIASPADAKFFNTDKFPESQLPDLPEGMKIKYVKSKLIFFSKKNISLGGFFQFSSDYLKIIKKLKPDIIYENPYTTLTPRSYMTYFAAKGLGIPIVYIDPGDIPPKGKAKRLLNRVEKNIVSYASHIISYNEMGKVRFIREYSCPENKVHVIPKPVDTHQFKPGTGLEEARGKIGAGNRFVVSYIGRLSNNKGSHHLMDAARRIKALGRSGEFLFLFAGGNIIEKDAMAIHSLKEKYSLDNVHFTGKVSHKEIVQYQAASDVVVYPDSTNLPSFSTVLAESMAMGKAIIIGNRGYEKATPLRHLDTGIIVGAGNVDEIINHINKLKDDVELKNRLGANVRKYAEEHMSWNTQVKIYKEIFESALS